MIKRFALILGLLSAVVTLVAQDFTLTVAQVGTGGTVTPGAGTHSYLSGTVVPVSAVANGGWTFDGWSGDLGGSTTPTTITMDGDKSITATFTQEQYTLTIISNHGTVTIYPDLTTYTYGTLVDLEAFADGGWTFSSWTGADVAGTNPSTVTMDGNRTVTANYTQDQYTLTIVSDHGTVTLDPDLTTYTYGTVVDLEAFADPGWTFSSWTGANVAGTNPSTVTMNGNRTVTANYTQNQYTLTIVSDHGTVALDPDQPTYTYGTVVDLEAFADPGWTFGSWTGADVAGTNPSTVTMNGNRTVTANYAQDQYTLTIVSDHGTVTLDPDLTTYTYGTVVDLEAFADPGWTFSSWTGANVAGTNPSTVTMNGNKTVTANYTQDQYTLTINTNGSGTVTPTPDKVTYVYGEVVNLSALANPGWTFGNWSGDASGTSANTSVTMNGDRTVTATFTQDQYTLTINTVGNGSVTEIPDQLSYTYGESVFLTAYAQLGWTFSQWTGDATGTGAFTSVIMDGDKTVTATFTQDAYTLDITIAGNGSVTKTPNQTTYLYGDVVDLSAFADMGWTFSDWSGDITSTSTSTSITMNGNKAVTATFDEDQYTLSISVIGNGSVTRVPDQATYTYGTTVDLNALSDPGWSFDTWAGNLTGTNPNPTITMDGDKTIQATFTQDIYPLTINITGLGTVTRSPNQQNYLSGTVVDLTAIAQAGWSFDNWSGDLTGTNPSTSVTMDGPKTINASFTQDIYTLSVNIIGNGVVTLTPSGGSYLSGTNVNLEALADVGWNFTNWTGDLGGSSTTTNILMDEDKSVTANFELNTYQVYLQTIPSGASAAVFTPSSPFSVSHGIAQNISVQDPAGYRFLNWSTPSADVAIATPGSDQTSITVTAGPAVVNANFQKTYNLTMTASIAQAVLSPSGTVVVDEGVPQAISVNELAGYRFLNWTVVSGTANINSPDQLSTEVTLNSEDATVRANFERIYTLTLESDLPNAVFDPASPLIVPHGTAQDISVSIPEGYDFVNWTVSIGTAYIVNPDLPATSVILTSGDVTLKANFELKEYQLELVAEGAAAVTFTPPSPITVRHGISQTISVTVPIGYSFNGWNTELGEADIANPGSATTTVTLTNGNALLRASFLKIVDVVDVSIPNATMKIGDIISATITVSNDANIPYLFVSGTIGGYPLTGFQRIDATTYLANFTIIEGGNSYSASQNIPVSGLVISDGIIQNVPYSSPIVQNNDLLDAQLPVISQMTVVSGNRRIGEAVILNISSDGQGYSILPSSLINGIAVSESNVSFTELSGGNYRLSYTVRQGDMDVGPGALEATITLVKPSGNIGLPYSLIANSANLTIDANPPVISQIELSQGEVGVGGTLRVAITADGTGYTAVAGTIINGIALSSSQVSFAEYAGGLYELSYTVESGDADVPRGDIQIQMVLADPAGNNSIPVSTVSANQVEIYTDLPTAVIAGTPEICEWEEAALDVFLGGRAPWSFDLFNGDSITSYEGIESATYSLNVLLNKTTTYNITEVRDRNGVVNNGSGNIQVKVNENTFVEFVNLLSGYSVDADPVELEANLPGGVFTGPGVISATGSFDPGIAGTENSPHLLQYTYTNNNGCTSVASALVFVLEASGDIFIPSDFVCTNQEAFTANASNVAGVDGSFQLLDVNSSPVEGLTDNGDNTALIDPSNITEGTYTLEYKYVDGTPFYLRKEFTVESAEIPVIMNLDDTAYCQSIDPIILQANVPVALFEGPGIISTPEGYVFDPSQAEPGVITIICTSQSAHGCSESIQHEVRVLQAPKTHFTLSTSCISAEGGVISFNNLTPDKLNVASWEWNFDDLASGENNTSSDIDTEHVFSELGPRRISLTATSLSGCTERYVLETSIGIDPVADFTWSSSCYKDQSGIDFIDQSDLGGFEADSLIWTFKDADGSILEQIQSSSGSPVNYEFNAEGAYLVDLYVYNVGGCADSISKEVALLPTIQLDRKGYEDSFDELVYLWTIGSEDGNSSWVLDEPDFTDFVPQAGDRAWFTRLPADAIDYKEESWIQSPCFDFAGMDRPMIQMDIMKSFIPNTNGAVLQYMDVAGEGWKTIGESKPGIEWYNSTALANRPGGSTVGWGLNVFNPDKQWVEAVHDLDQVAGKPGVSFRIVLTSTGAQGIGNQGFAFNNVRISERSKISVLEHFTNSSDIQGISADNLIDSLGESYSRDVVSLQYHMDYPGYDPMNQNNPVPATTRAFYYGIPSVPFAVLDGGTSELFRYGFSDLKTTPILDYIGLGTLQKPAFDINLTAEWKEDSLLTTTEVTCITDSYAEYIQLFLVVFETSVSAYTGLNGDTLFKNVVLDMLPPSAGGKLLSNGWEFGQTDTMTNDWAYQPYIEDLDDLAVLAFVQDRRTGQILQAAVNYKDKLVDLVEVPELSQMRIYPNPAKDVLYVNVGSTTQENGVIRILDMNGRLVHTEYMPAGHQIYQLDIHDLIRGMYVLHWMESGQVRGVKKIVKTR